MPTQEAKENADAAGGKPSPRLLAGVALAALALFAFIVILLCAGLLVLFLRAEAEPTLPLLYAL